MNKSLRYWLAAPLLATPIIVGYAIASPAEARDIPVSTDTALQQAINTAKAGDRILLASGKRFGPLLIEDRNHKNGMVVIDGKGAQLDNVQFIKSSGWAVENTEFMGVLAQRGRTIRIDSSENIRIAHNFIHGINLNNDGWDDLGGGILVRLGKNIDIIGNRIQDFRTGITLTTSSNVKVAGNRIAFIREGMNVVSMENLTVRCNYLSDFNPNYAKKEHPDAMQGWNSQNAAGSTNMLFEGNYISTGGAQAVHGIFIQSAADKDSDPARRNRNLTIRDNIYYGSALHGISIGGAVDLTITNNTVLASPHTLQDPVPARSADGRNSSALIPKIRATGEVTTGTIAKNISTSFTIPQGFQSADNFSIRSRARTQGAQLKEVFVNAPEGSHPDITSFQVRPDSPAGKAGAGARAICGKELPAR